MYITAVYSFFFLHLLSFSNLCKYRNLRDLRDPLYPQCKAIDRGGQMPAAGMWCTVFLRRAEKETKTETLPPCLTVRRLWGEQEETCVTALVVRVLRWVSWEGGRADLRCIRWYSRVRDEPIFI